MANLHVYGYGNRDAVVGLAIGLLGPEPIPEGRRVFVEVIQDGVIAAFEPDPWRMTMFWFLAFGFLLLALGALAHHLERQDLGLPRWFGWFLIVLGVTGGLCIPVSGFWLVVPQGWLVLRRA